MSHHSAWDGAIFLCGPYIGYVEKCIVGVLTIRQRCLDNASMMARQCVDGGLTMRRRWLDNALLVARRCIVGKWAMFQRGMWWDEICNVRVLWGWKLWFLALFCCVVAVLFLCGEMGVFVIMGMDISVHV